MAGRRHYSLANQLRNLDRENNVAGFNVLLESVNIVKVLELFKEISEAIYPVASLAIQSRNWELIQWISKFPKFREALQSGIQEAIHDPELVDFMIGLGIYPSVKDFVQSDRLDLLEHYIESTDMLELISATINAGNQKLFEYLSQYDTQLALTLASNSGSEDMLIYLFKKYSDLKLDLNIIQSAVDAQNLTILRGIWPSVLKFLDSELILRILKTRNNEIIQMLFIPGVVFPPEALTEAIEQENLPLVDALLRRPEFLQLDKSPYLRISDNIQILDRLLRERRVFLDPEIVTDVIDDAIRTGAENYVALANLLLSYRPNINKNFLRQAQQQLPNLKIPTDTRHHQLENEFELPSKR